MVVVGIIVGWLLGAGLLAAGAWVLTPPAMPPGAGEDPGDAIGYFED